MTELRASFSLQKPTVQADFNIQQKQFDAAFTLNVGDKHFTYTQATPSDTWVITHNLNKMPSITVVDSAGTIFFGEYTYNDENTVTLTFNGAFSGQAFLN